MDKTHATTYVLTLGGERGRNEGHELEEVKMRERK